VAGANVHDTKLLEATIDAIVVERPTQDEMQEHLCLDKGYDNPTGRAAAQNGGYAPHIRRIGEEVSKQETPRAALGGRTHAGLAEPLPCNPCALQQGSVQLPRPDSTGLHSALVSSSMAIG
jgi:hypothetical protein